MALFNSLILLKMSLFFKINSLFQILGNFRKKHPRLLRFLTSQTPNLARNRRTSLYFPCRSGNSPQRLVRSRLHHPAASPAKRFISVLGISPDPLRLLQDFTERNGATLVAPASSPNDSLSHRVFSRLFGSSSQGS